MSRIRDTNTRGVWQHRLPSFLASKVGELIRAAAKLVRLPGPKFVFGMFSATALPLLAQTGEIAGMVTDPAHAIVVGARVSVTDVVSNLSTTVVTDDRGNYVVSNLAPGFYRVEAQVKGFKTFVADGVAVKAGQSTDADVHLGFSSQQTSVNVAAQQDDLYAVQATPEIGPFGQMQIQDLPYSLNVMPQALIEDLQASTVDQLFRINPFVEPQVPQTRSGSGVGYIRGFNVTAEREDGLYAAFPIVDIEDKQEVEVLTGSSGFLYGANPPGGLVDYILKRPTPIRYSSLDFGTYGGSSLYGHADLGGPIDREGKFGYRLNLLGQGGDTAIDNQNVSRFLISGALDWHISSKAVLQIDASDSYYRVDGSPAVWQFVSEGPAPRAPSAGRLWGQKYDVDKYLTNKEGARFNWNLSRIFTVRAGFAHMSYERSDFYTNNQIATGNGSYNIIGLPFAPRDIATFSGQGFLDAVFSTGFIKHRLTLGFDGSNYDERRHQDQSAVITLGTASSFFNPDYLPMPSYTVGVKPLVNFSRTLESNFLIGDVMELGKSWSVIAGVTNAGVLQENYSLASASLSARYDKRAWTPTASVVYKPVSEVSTYFTYIEGLQQGGTAPTTAANAGVQLPPDRSREYELGVKATVGKALVTAALFDVNEAFEYTDPADNTYKAAGREDHKGLEIGISGKVFRNLNVYGGLTLLRPRIADDAADPALEGRVPTNVAERLFKLYGEYQLPQFRALAFTAGIYHTGPTELTNDDLFSLPGFTTGDLGVRYEKRVEATPVIFRVNVTNVTNKSYWTSVTGTNLYTGDPRSVAASIQVKF